MSITPFTFSSSDGWVKGQPIPLKSTGFSDGWYAAPDRIAAVQDPIDSTRLAARFTLKPGDFDPWGGCRAERWRYESGHYVAGDEFWVAFAVTVPSYVTLNGGLLMQIHGGIGSPPICVTYNGTYRIALASAPDYPHTPRFSDALTTNMVYGHWHYILIHAKLATGAGALVQVWHELDGPPDPTTPPTVERSYEKDGLKTSYGQTGKIHVGPYLPASMTNEQHVFIRAYAVDLTAAKALAVFGATPSPPMPPPSTGFEDEVAMLHDAALADYTVSIGRLTTIAGYKRLTVSQRQAITELITRDKIARDRMVAFDSSHGL